MAMNLLDRIRAAFAPVRVMVNAVGGSAANLAPSGDVALGGGQPGVWGYRGVRVPMLERQVNSIILSAAIRRLGREVASARIDGIDDYPDYPFRSLLAATARTYYLDGGFYLWGRREMRPGLEMPPVFTLIPRSAISPSPYTFGGRIPLNEPSAYRYGDNEIPADEVAIVLTATQPYQADVRLADVVKVETAAIRGQAKASANAARPRLHVGIDTQARRPAISKAVASGNDPNNVSGNLQSTINALAAGDIVATFAGETLSVLNYSADIQFAQTMNEVAQLVSADSGIPAPFLGSTENLTFANAVQLTRVMYESTIIPIAREIQDAIRAQGLFPEFTLDFSEHQAILQTETERALLTDRRATAFERFARGGIERDVALGLAGVRQAPTDADDSGRSGDSDEDADAAAAVGANLSPPPSTMPPSAAERPISAE